MSGFIPQVYGLEPKDLPVGISPLFKPGQQAAPSAQDNLPATRPNPRTYLMFYSDSYGVVGLEDTNRIELARAKGEKTAVLDAHGEVNIEFKAHASLDGVMSNSTGKMYVYTPQWFFLDDQLNWSPMSPSMCADLNRAKKNGEAEARDSERTYFMTSYNQINRESSRIRPLLYLRDDGSAVRGDCMPQWAFKRSSRGMLTTGAVNFATAERLEKAYGSGAADIEVEIQPPRATGNVKCKITFARASDEHPSVGADGNKYPFVRFSPTWFFLSDQMTWTALDYGAVAQLDQATAYGGFSTADNEREYDLLRLLQVNVGSSKVRPLVQVRGQTGATAPTRQPLADFPDVAARANIVLKPLPATAIAAAIRDMNVSPAKRILHFCNALVHEYQFVVKGGILRDAVVNDDISHSHDIDVEIAAGFTPDKMMGWVDKFLAAIEKKYGVKANVAKQIETRSTSDIFGGGGARSMCQKGMLTIPLLFPGDGQDLAIDLECCTPWNSAYQPPKNVDVSVNNLRITRDSKEMSLNVNFPYETADYPPQKKNMTVDETVGQILKKEASPSYDYKWVAGDGADHDGEGRSKNQWVVGACDFSHFRMRVMEGRFEKMRGKGYRMVEGPTGK